MTDKMKSHERLLLVVASVLIVIGSFLPIWRIEIWAPQYPEGLVMQIDSNQITGNVDQINILNHYIGMRKIIPSEIPELRVIPWVLTFTAALGLLVAFWSKRKLAKAWLLVNLAGVTIGMIDFFIWGYSYGHTLNPHAPIKIPGLSYQPPLIGHKTILNIDSYSIPDLGCYVLGAAFLLAVLGAFGANLSQPLWAHEKNRPTTKSGNDFVKFSLILLLPLFFSSCTSSQAEPIKIGEDHCDACRMVITDNHFGGEVVTAKGRLYKFDSISCLLEFVSANKDVKQILVEDYFHPGTLIDAKTAYYLNSSSIKTPMPGPIAASNREVLAKAEKTKTVLDWNAVSSAAQ